MKTVGVAIAAVLLAAGPASGQQASSQPMSGPEELKTEKAIRAMLHKERGLRNDRIDVEVANGVVTLKGKVDAEAERTKAKTAAWANGVTRVNDWLVVDSRAAKKGLSDSSVTTEIETQYRADKTLGHADISVVTNDGVVTLAGVIPSESARRRAIDVAETSPGVTRVEDKMRAAGEL